MLSQKQAVARPEIRSSARFIRQPRPVTVVHAASSAPAPGALRSPSPQLLSLLEQAARTKSVQPQDVERSLLELEASCSGARNAGTERVPGRWRLVYSSATSIRAFQYIPVVEDLVIDVDAKTINLESVLGPFNFYIRGSMLSWDVSTGVLGFQFDRGMAIHLFGNQVWETTPQARPPKTYTFFYVGNSICAARSSAGGLALLLRDP